MSERDVLIAVIGLVICVFNYYIGKARGASEERERWMRRCY